MPSPDRRLTVEDQEHLAARQLVARVLTDAIAVESTSARAALEPTIRPGGRVAAVLPGGEEIGHVGRSKVSRSVTVTDEAALLAYVTRARPDEIVTTIRPSFRTYLLAEAKRQLADPDGPGEVIDHDGEVIPGLALAERAPSYRQEISDEGAAIVRERLAALFGGDLATVIPALGDGS